MKGQMSQKCITKGKRCSPTNTKISLIAISQKLSKGLTNIINLVTLRAQIMFPKTLFITT
jgi:hypothetical protein